MATIEHIQAIPISTCGNLTMPRQSAFGDSKHPIYSKNLGNTSLFLLREAANKCYRGERLEISFNASDEFEHLHTCYEAFRKAYSWYPLPIIHFLEKIIRVWTLELLMLDADCDYLLLNDYTGNRKKYHKHYGMSLASACKKLPPEPVKINVLKFDDIARIAGTHLELLQREHFEKPLPGTDQNADWRCIIEQIPFDNNQDNYGTDSASKGSIDENPRHPGCPLCQDVLNNAVWDRVEACFISNRLWNNMENGRLHKKVWDYAPAILQENLSFKSYDSISNSRIFVDQIYNNIPEIMQIIDSLKKQKADFKKKSKKFSQLKIRDDEPITRHEIQRMYTDLEQDYPQLYPQYIRIRYITTKETDGFNVGRYIMGEHPDGDFLHFKYDTWLQFKEIEERLRKIELLIQTMDATTIKEFSPEINGELCVMGWRRVHDPAQWFLPPKELRRLRLEMRNQLAQKMQMDVEKSLLVPRIILNELRNKYPGIDERYLVGLHWAEVIGMRVEEAGASAKNGLTGDEDFRIEQFGGHMTLLTEIGQAMDAVVERLDENHNNGTIKSKTILASSKYTDGTGKDSSFVPDIWSAAVQQTYKRAMLRCRLAMDVVNKDLKRRFSTAEKTFHLLSFTQPLWYNALLLKNDPLFDEEDRIILWYTAEIHLYESQETFAKPRLPHQTEMEGIQKGTVRLSEKLQKSMAIVLADKEVQEAKKGQSVGVKGVGTIHDERMFTYIEAAKSVLRCMSFWREEIKTVKDKFQQELNSTQKLEHQRSSSDSTEQHFSVDTPPINDIDWNNLLLEYDPVLDGEDRTLLWTVAAVERWELAELQIKPQLPDLTKVEDTCRKLSRIGDKLESAVGVLISDMEKQEAVRDGVAKQGRGRPPEERVALYFDTANAVLRCMYFWREQFEEQGKTEYSQVVDNHKQKLEDFTKGQDGGGQRFNGASGNHGGNLRLIGSSDTIDDDEYLSKLNEAVVSEIHGIDSVRERSSITESAEVAAHSLLELSRSVDPSASEVEDSQPQQMEGMEKEKNGQEQVM